MGTFGTGPFDSDGARDFLDGFAELPVGQRPEVLERMFLVVQNEPELADRGYDADAILVTEADHELAALALNALGRTAGRDGPWRHGWTSPDDAVRARQTTEQLAVILEQGQRGQDG